MRQVLPFDWFTTDHLVSGESTLHQVTLFSARSRIFLPIAQSCAALFCCRLAIRASSLGWLVGNNQLTYAIIRVWCNRLAGQKFHSIVFSIFSKSKVFKGSLSLNLHSQGLIHFRRTSNSLPPYPVPVRQHNVQIRRRT